VSGVRVYLDHNATTPLRPEARAAWLDALEGPANASSLHASGRRARHLLDEARERVAAALGVREDEVVFTANGTEANNLALFGFLEPLGTTAGLLTTTIEHSSVRDAALELERRGHPVTRVAVDGEGFVDASAVEEALARPGDVRLASILWANNEVGTVQDLGRLAEPIARAGARLHVDAVQALGRLDVAFEDPHVDLASFSAHKVGGPVGVGVLVRRADVALRPLLFGGGQEGGLRPGTESVATIVAASVAIELAVREQREHAARLRALSTRLWAGLVEAGIEGRLLGPDLESGKRLPGTLDIAFGDVDGKVLVTRLDVAGLEIGAGSACASGAVEPSHVLMAMGLDEERARAAVRLSLGRTTTDADVDNAVDILRTTLGQAHAT